MSEKNFIRVTSTSSTMQCSTYKNYTNSSIAKLNGPFVVPKLHNYRSTDERKLVAESGHVHRPACKGWPFEVVKSNKNFPNLSWWMEKHTRAYEGMSYHPAMDEIFRDGFPQGVNFEKSFPGNSEGLAYVVLAKHPSIKRLLIVWAGTCFQDRKALRDLWLFQKTGVGATHKHEQDHAVPVPYTSRLLAQIEPGQSLVVHGQVQPSADRFEINLLNDCLEINPHAGSVPLHVSVRLDEGGKIVLNSFLGGEWGNEVRHSSPFSQNEPFDVRIRVHEDKYEIFANQKHVADFKHRVAFTTVDHLQVKGDISLSGVHWGGRYFASPFETHFHEHSLRCGQRVYIYGIPKGDFSVNFTNANGDSLFHFNPRFSEKAIVRNSQSDGVWGQEEREGAFPFKKSIGFDLVIHNEPYSLQLFLDGQRIGTYAHRTPNPDIDYKTLKVDGQVDVTGVEVSHN